MFTKLGRAFRQSIGQPLWRLAAGVIPDYPRRKRSAFYLRKAIALWLGRDKTTVWLTCDQPNLHSEEPLQVAGPTDFRGWALSARGIASVSFSCDGVRLGEACRGVPRPDVVALASHLRQSSRCGFHFLLDPRALPAGAHELTIKAESYDGAVAVHTCKFEVVYTADDYAAWRGKRAASSGMLAWMRRHVGNLPDHPRAALFMRLDAETEPAPLLNTIRSLREQVYPYWMLAITCDKPVFEKLGEFLGRLTAQDDRVDVHVEPFRHSADGSGCPADLVEAELWGLVEAGDLLEPSALFEVVYYLNRDPQTDFVYTDEDFVMGPGVRDFPVLKPDWSRELLEEQNRIGRLWLARRKLILDFAGQAATLNLLEKRELLVKLTNNAHKIGHIRSVLYSRARRPVALEEMALASNYPHYSTVNDADQAVTCAPLPMLDLQAIENILVVMLDHLGDVLLTFPAIERLREMFPQARITALVGSWSESLVRGNACIDEILSYDFFDASSAEPHRLMSVAEERRIENWLSGRGFDLAVDFRREPETRDFLRLSRARYTVGFSQGKEAEWLSVALPCEPNIQWVRPRRHVTQELIHLVEMIGVAGRSNICPRIEVSGAEQAGVEEVLRSVIGDDERVLVAIHPGSGRSIKCWPAEHFAGLADRLVERLHARVVWFGSSSEAALVKNILQRMSCRSETVSLAGHLSIPQLLAALGRFDLFIGNDSGPTHLAAGMGMPTLCVCSGTIDPLQWAPVGPAALVVHRLMSCSPCYLRDREECPFEVACLRDLPVDAVWEAAMRALLPRWHKLLHTPEFAVQACEQRVFPLLRT